jgi:glycosyltransferase involved in cell wall biosynthesis
VVVGHDYRSNALVALARGRRGPPRVAVVHGYTAEDPKVRAFEAVDRRRLRSARAVVAVSDAIARSCARAGVRAERLHTVENGVDVRAVAAAARASRDAVRAGWGVAPDVPVLLAAGRFSPEKGQDVLVEALARVHAAGGARPALVLLGDGVLRPDLERAAARLPAGSVRFDGWRDDPWARLGAADVFVLPSRREGLPLALLEAMAAGLPVVATRVGGVPTALDDGRCGALVPPDDPGALADAVLALLRDPALRARLASAAAARAGERYDVERQVRALEAVYRGLAP